MLYLVALFIPALALLLRGKILWAIVSLVLQVTLFGWPVATILAWIILATDHPRGVNVTVINNNVVSR